MTVPQLKKQLHDAIDDTENEALLKAINALLASGAKHPELILPGEPMSEETFISLVNEAEEDYKAGKYFSHEDVLKEVAKWGKKKSTK